jgi:hypothetical protein
MDPSDDGTVTPAHGYEPYPAGPARNPSSVQRGSVQFLSVYPGDPSTPGAPAYRNATRVAGPAGSRPRIPSLPVSWENARVLLGRGGRVRLVNRGAWVLALVLRGKWAAEWAAENSA